MPMNPSSISTFGAAGSMTGYLYQVRLGLLWAIRRSRTSDFTVSIETLDDVSFEVGGQPDAVLHVLLGLIFVYTCVVTFREQGRVIVCKP